MAPACRQRGGSERPERSPPATPLLAGRLKNEHDISRKTCGRGQEDPRGLGRGWESWPGSGCGIEGLSWISITSRLNNAKVWIRDRQLLFLPRNARRVQGWALPALPGSRYWLSNLI